MYNNRSFFTISKIIAIVLFAGTGISAYLAYRFGVCLIDSLNYIFADTEKAMTIAEASAIRGFVSALVSWLLYTFGRFAWRI